MGTDLKKYCYAKGGAWIAKVDGGNEKDAYWPAEVFCENYSKQWSGWSWLDTTLTDDPAALPRNVIATATKCTCKTAAATTTTTTASTIFSLGISLLAILASLWK